MEVKYRKYKNYYILDLIGELDLYNTSTLFDAIDNVSKRNMDSLILNMSNISYIDSSGIGALIKGHTERKAAGKGFIISGISESINQVFTLSGLIHFFVIEDNVSDALQKLVKNNIRGWNYGK